jgi:hypothetical protein
LHLVDQPGGGQRGGEVLDAKPGQASAVGWRGVSWWWVPMQVRQSGGRAIGRPGSRAVRRSGGHGLCDRSWLRLPLPLTYSYHTYSRATTGAAVIGIPTLLPLQRPLPPPPPLPPRAPAPTPNYPAPAPYLLCTCYAPWAL